MSQKPKDEHAVELTRRELLALGGAATAGALVSSAVAPAKVLAEAAKNSALPQVPRRVLGKTKQEIPILLLGGAVGFDMRFDPKIAEAMRFGINYIDAAAVYDGGNCELAVAAFHKRAKARKQLWITSKSEQHDPAGFEATVTQSLKKLETDFIDMYYLHAVKDAKVLTPELEKLVARLKSEGKIRHFGFSCHDGNVAELLHAAAKTPWVESVMFRYDFRKYGDKPLNKAIDAAHEAGVGLIAMKTQGSEVGFREAWQKFEQSGKWNKHQAVLKAVWADTRITAAVSHMDSFEKLRQNIAAALDKSELTQAEQQELERYAAQTRSLSCDGCDHLCGAHVAAPVRIADTLRFVMYHDTYGEPDKARELFGKLPAEARDFAHVDFGAASQACPYGVDIARHMKRALTVLT